MPLLNKKSTYLRLGCGAFLALGLAALQGCGGGGSGSSSGPTALTTLAGAWKATNTDGSPIYALIVPTSGGSSSTFTYRTIETTPASGGVNQLFGSDLTLASSGGAVTSQNASAIFAASTAGGAQAFTGGSISGTANSSGMPLTFTPTPPSSYPTLGETFTPDTAANQLQITPASLAGQYTATAGNTSVGTATTLNVTVAANGSLQFVDTANQVNGSAIQIGTSNAFTVNATLNGNAAGFSGLAYAVPGAAANTYNLIVMTSNASNQSLAGIFTYQGPLPLTTLAGTYRHFDTAGAQDIWGMVTAGTGSSYNLRFLTLASIPGAPGQAIQATGTISLNTGSQTDLTGSVTILPPIPNGGVPAGSQTNALTGTANTSGLTFSLAGGPTETFLPDPATYLSLNLSSLAGQYTSLAINNSVGVPVTVNVTLGSAANTLTFQDTAGLLNGTATQIGTTDGFTVVATFNYPGSTSTSPTTFNGMAYALPVAGTSRYILIVMLDNGNTYSLAGFFN